MVGELRPSAPDSRVRKAPNRQSRSCKVCRIRKVKCDRVKPCHACCAHGYPSKCVYENIPDEEARPITQAEEIRNLRAEIRELRTKVDERRDGSGDQELERLDQLEGLFESIRSAPSSVVDQLVREIRSAHGGVKRSLVKVGPWEGHEAYEGYDYTGGSRRSVIPIRRSTRDSSWEVNFNDPLQNEDDENGELEERMSLSSGSESGSSGTISVMSMQRPAVDIFVERFVDAFSPEVDIKSGRAGALRAAAEIRMFSPLISDAFEAVSVAFFGRSVQNKEIEASGFRLYPRVLRGLQDALIDPERSKSEATLVTVTLLLAFESVERTTHSGVPAHVRGAVRLIEHRGPENHMYGVEHLLFTELRPYWIGGAMATRQPSFLAREEWKTIPWSAGTTTKDILHHLLDLAAEVPALLAQSDQFQEAQESSVMGAQEMTVKQAALWNGITDLTGRFYQWHRDWVECYPDGPPQEAEQKGDQGFPIFRRRDLRTGAVYAATKLIYPNLLLAQTMCVYYAVRLILSSIDTRPVDRVSLLEKYELGCGICRTYEFYILTAPGNMINRLAFPTRVAWEAFPDGGPERAFMAEVLSLVERRHSLGLWGGNMSELSTHKDSPLNSDP
ncbi:transcriptional regulator family: Fungal Specific TF [Penicillium malachiteum]|uniref:Transcriptional regulator family: Fungal Specific TF n=1 Tax=Penicillium malachiteum TaxID=1324776 RepID=A0AAD6HC65_9EURO|nr:transcriptional regulator family: Fungal Specific TF [Penicillium malachiteum]